MTAQPRVIPFGEELPSMESANRRAGKHGQKADKPAHKPKRSAGRWQTLNHFADHTAKTLDSFSVALWLQLFRMAGADGRVRVSQVELGRRVGKSPRSVYSALRRLQAAGVLTVLQRGTLRTGASVYRITARRKGTRE